MKSFILAYREFLYWQTLKSTTPKLIFFNGRYMVTLFYSEETVLKIGAEIVDM